MTDPDQLLTEYETRLDEVQRKAELVRDGLSSTRATARSADGQITATVNASGNLVDLRIGNVRDQEGPEIAQQVMHTVRRAQSKLVDAVRDSMSPDVGSSLLDELDKQYRDSYPAPSDDEPDRTRRRTLRIGADVEADDAPRPTPPPRRRPPTDHVDDTDYSDRGFLR
jgi:DNA-binding protein YbaB